MEKKANHQANIVRIKEILPHTNADTLEIIPIGEYQVVSKKGQFAVGDLAVYIQPDSVVPQTEPFRFIWEPYLIDRANTPHLCQHANSVVKCKFGNEEVWQCTNCMLVNPQLVPEKKRRITVRKFRSEWSEGLLLPISDFPELYREIDPGFKSLNIDEGDDVSDLLGITHYDPDAGSEDGSEEFAPKEKKKKYPKTLRGWIGFILAKFRIRRSQQFLEQTDTLGIPVYDVNALKNYPDTFEEHEPVIVTEKIHGSNARYLFHDGTMYVGSRNKWTAPGSSNPFRNALKLNPWIEEWCRAHEGHVLWGEVTGVQKGFDYGSKDNQFFVFDVRKPDGTWAEYGERIDTTGLDGHFVPILYIGPYDLEKIKTLVDGNSTVEGAKHIREGIVIKSQHERRIRGVGRTQMKIVSNKFLEKDNK